MGRITHSFEDEYAMGKITPVMGNLQAAQAELRALLERAEKEFTMDEFKTFADGILTGILSGLMRELEGRS